jgi:hypothetical protein
MSKFLTIYNYLSTRNYTHFLLLALLIKGLIADVSYSTVLLTVPVLCFEAYHLYIKAKRPEPVVFDTELRKELDNIKSKLNAGSLEKNINVPKRYF